MNKLSTKELVQLYNQAAKKLGKPTVKRFSTKAVAIARVKTIAGQKLARRPDFNFKSTVKPRTPRAGSYLEEALALLTVGCQYEDLVKLVKKLDKKRGSGNAESIPRRSYELVRDLHFLNGYSVKHNQSTGFIKINRR